MLEQSQQEVEDEVTSPSSTIATGLCNWDAWPRPLLDFLNAENDIAPVALVFHIVLQTTLIGRDGLLIPL